MSTGFPLGTRGGALVSLHVPAGRRVRHPDPADARPQRARRRADASRTSSSCCSTRARVQIVHGEAAAATSGRASTADADQHLKVRVPVKAGPHELGVTFLKNRRRCSRPRASRTRRTSTTTGIRGSRRRSTRSRSSARMTPTGAGRHAEPAPRSSSRGPAKPQTRKTAAPGRSSRR